jgi:protein TonB
MPISDMLSSGRRGWRRWSFAAASVAAHAALLAALVMATAEEEIQAEPDRGPEEVTYVDIRRFAPPPPPADAATPEPAQPEPVRPQPRPTPTQPARPDPTPRTPPRATDLVDPVDSLPDPLGEDLPPQPPAPDPELTGTDLPSRVEPVAGGRAGGVEGGEAGGQVGGVVGGQGEEVPDPGGTYTAAVVDRAAELSNRGDLPRLMRRLYPSVLQDARIEGRVVVQFVVDTNGRADMSTVKIISATHDGFIEPTRKAIREFRFRPARMGDVKVRMLTQLPIVWEVAS